MMKNLLLAMATTVSLAAFTLERDKTTNRTPTMPTSGEYVIEEGQGLTETVEEGFHSSTGYVRTMEENGTFSHTGDLNLSNNRDMKEFFKYRGDQTNAMHVINALGNKDETARDMYVIDREKLTTQYLQEAHPDSNDTNHSLRAGVLNEYLVNHSVEGKHISCYVKRELIPKYRCPLDGMDHTLYGGHPSDDSMSVKRTCDEVCETPSMGCRGASSGFTKTVTSSSEFTFDASGTQSEQTVSLPINTTQRLSAISYTVTVQKGAMSWDDFAMAPVVLPYKIAYTDVLGHERVMVRHYPYALDRDEAVISIGSIPDAKEVRITFYPPLLEKIGAYKEYMLGQLLGSVKISDIETRYTSDEYFFCSLGQIVSDPSTQCDGGKIYNVNGSGGSFKVCVREEGLKGPEPVYHGFYSEESCNQACVIREECIPTFEHYTYAQITNPTAYRISVGCADTPGNGACSPSLCEEMMRSEQMPDREVVYSPTKTARYTVVAGAELPDARRPKLDLAGEATAAASGDYEGVFTETMKDAAYDNMIKSGTFNYVASTIAQGTEAQYAYNRAVYRDPSPYKPPRIQLQWMIKPKSTEYDGMQYKFYVVAKHEVIYHPISGLFLTGDSYSTSYSSENAPYFKDEVYSYLRNDGTYQPFFVKEYAWLQENNVSVGEWKKNLQSMQARFVYYNAGTDEYYTASPSLALTPFETKVFSRSVNWETFEVASGIAERIMTGYRGMTFVRQETTGPTVLPIKRWAGDRDETAGSLGRVRFYGFYQPDAQQLTAQEVVDTLEDDDEAKKFIFYDSDRYRSLPDEITGDGAMPSAPVRLFLKGMPGALDASVQLLPRVQDEGKQGVLFMYLYKEN